MKSILFVFLLTGLTVAAQAPSFDPGRAQKIREAMAARKGKTNAPVSLDSDGPGVQSRTASRATTSGAAGGPAAVPPPGGAPPPGAPGGAPGGLPAPADGGPGGTIAMPPPSTSGNTSTNFMEETLPAGVLKLQGVDMQQALLFYSELVGRTVLRPNTLPNTPITLWAQSDLTRREAIQAMDAVFGLNGITMINVGEKFVKAVVQASANMEAAPFHKGDASQLPEMGQYVTHVVQLKYAKPTEMAQALTPLCKIPNAAMAIDSSMILILRDYAENVKRMLELIKEVDVSIPSEFVSEVIPIKYALSADIANALNSLGSGGGGTSIGSSGTSGGTTGSRSSFGGRSGASGSGSSRFGGSSYGTGMQSGTMPGFNQMGTTAGAQTTPGAAGSFTDRLRNLMSRAAVSGDIQVIGQTKIIADERTNSLLIFATREDMKVIKDIVAKLDVVLAQVLIEAVIIEVQIGPNTKDFGISYLQHPQSSGNVSGVGAIGKPFLSPSDFVSSGGTNGSAAALQGGFNYLASFGQDLDITLQAIATETRAKVLQRPRIQTSHAVQAQLFVGESRPYPTSSYYGGGAYGSYSSIQQLQIGVTLDVTPLINPDGLVVMDIHQTIENYSGFTEITGVGQVPNTTRKEAAAKVAVRDRDTIMLGGLIEDDKNRSGSGVPFLMDIPIIGYLFRSTSTGQTRKELIVLIRPTVLPTPEVAAMTALSEKERMPGVRRAEAEFLSDEEKQLLRTQEELRQLENPDRKKKPSDRWIDRVD